MTLNSSLVRCGESRRKTHLCFHKERCPVNGVADEITWTTLSVDDGVLGESEVIWNLPIGADLLGPEMLLRSPKAAVSYTHLTLPTLYSV